MKKLFFSFVIVLCASSASLKAQIIEVHHFGELVKHATLDTLILLDIDDTLIIPEQMVGCDDWFMLRIKNYLGVGFDKTEALEKTLAEWEAVRHITKMKIVEKGTESIVAKLQQTGYHVMGLTTQGLALATRTVQQLKENNIDLSIAAPSKDDFYVTVNGHSVLYRKGILFTSGQDKGQAFFAFCDNFGLVPKRVVFINDKASHLREVEPVAEKRGVDFVGLRYGYSDIHKSRFKPEIAEIQFSHSSFAKIMTDKEAEEYLFATQR